MWRNKYQIPKRNDYFSLSPLRKSLAEGGGEVKSVSKVVLEKIDELIETKIDGMSPIGNIVSLLILLAKNQEKRLKILEKSTRKQK